MIDRQLFPLLSQAGFSNVTVSPRMVYVDASRPGLVEGFTKNTFIAMVEGVRKQALDGKLIEEVRWEKGISDLYRGYAVLTFSIEKPGTYQFSAWYSEEQAGQEVVLTIGHGFMKKLLGTIFSGLAIMFGTVAMTIVIAIMTLVKRRKARRHLEGLG